MKKHFFLFASVTLLSISSLFAQEGRQQRSADERTKATMEKFQDFNLKPEVRTQVEAIFNDFYKNQQATMQAARDASSDRTVVMDKRKQLVSERNNKLKEVLSAEQYDKWVSDIEPSLKPVRQKEVAPTPATPAN